MNSVSILMYILEALKWLIFIDVILSWVMPDAERFPRNFTRQITDPLYAPIRAILRPDKMGGFDISPMIMLLIVHAMQRMLARAA